MTDCAGGTLTVLVDELRGPRESPALLGDTASHRKLYVITSRGDGRNL